MEETNSGFEHELEQKFREQAIVLTGVNRQP